MKNLWKRKSDDELVARVRRWHGIGMKWRRQIYAFITIAILFVVICVVMEAFTPYRMLRSLFRTPTVNFASYTAGYLAGLATGTLFNGALIFFVTALYVISGDLRRDHLLLNYYDRLKQAGLLPPDSAGPPQPDEPPPKNMAPTDSPTPKN